MATKPSVEPEYWATDAVYTNGPYVGQPQKVVPPPTFAAEGHLPGANNPTPAEYENSQQNRITGLVRWVFAGSSAGGADAHPLETNAAGRTAVTGLTVNDGVNETAVSVTGVGVLVPAMLVTNTSGGGGVIAQIGNTNAAGFATTVGSGSGFGLYTGMASTLAGGAGVRIDADAATASSAVVVNHAGSGTSLEINASGTGTGFTITHTGNVASATVITAGVNARAMIATGSGTGQGGVFQSGASCTSAALLGRALTSTAIGVDGEGGSGSSAGTGVRGTGTHADATGVYGRTSTSASTTATGVTAEGRGIGSTGLLALNTVGRAAVFQGDTTTPAYAATRWVPQDEDPSSGTQDGEVYWNSSHKTLRTSVPGAGWRSMMTMGPGSAFVVNAALDPDVAPKSVTVAYTVALTVIADPGDGTGFYGEALGAKVMINFNADLRLTIGPTADTLNVLIYDVTNAQPVHEWTGDVPGSNQDNGFYIPTTHNLRWGHCINIGLQYAPPTDGELEINVQVSRVNNNLQMRAASLTMIGTL